MKEVDSLIKYFDHAATTGVDKEVLAQMMPYFSEKYGNPSSVYRIGKENKEAINVARMKVAESLNCKLNEVYFTSCGSESDNLALKGIAKANFRKGNHIITTKIEHPAILNTCKTLENEGFKVTYLNVNKNGMIDLKELENSITPKTILISIMFANNEIGTIEPIKEIGKIAKRYGIFFHTDAVQAVGNVKIDVKELGITALSMSAHKFYGPKGVGALYVREGVPFIRIQDGGHQEKEKRAGTENVPGIVGLGKAIELANRNLVSYNKKLLDFREYYFSEMERKIPNILINGDRSSRLPGNANICFKGVDGAKLLYELDKREICASSGSACSAGLLNPSHVLLAIGVPSQIARSSLRITFGKENTFEDVKFLVNSIEEIVNNLRKNG
jgi:cysteine desulfurase